MKDINVKEFSNEIFDLTEDSVYDVINTFKEDQHIDKSLTYIYIKAFYLHTLKMYMVSKKNVELFEEIYSNYRMYLSIYYKSNNAQIPQELLDDLLNAFDKSFEILESISFNDFENSYEFRHHIADVFELLRQILEKKSKSQIRQDTFENHISTFKSEAEKVIDYAKTKLN